MALVGALMGGIAPCRPRPARWTLWIKLLSCDSLAAGAYGLTLAGTVRELVEKTIINIRTAHDLSFSPCLGYQHKLAADGDVDMVILTHIISDIVAKIIRNGSVLQSWQKGIACSVEEFDAISAGKLGPFNHALPSQFGAPSPLLWLKSSRVWIGWS